MKAGRRPAPPAQHRAHATAERGACSRRPRRPCRSCLSSPSRPCIRLSGGQAVLGVIKHCGRSIRVAARRLIPVPVPCPGSAVPGGAVPCVCPSIEGVLPGLCCSGLHCSGSRSHCRWRPDAEDGVDGLVGKWFVTALRRDDELRVQLDLVQGDPVVHGGSRRSPVAGRRVSARCRIVLGGVRVGRGTQSGHLLTVLVIRVRRLPDWPSADTCQLKDEPPQRPWPGWAIRRRAELVR